GDEFCVVIEGSDAHRAGEVADLALDLFKAGRAGRSLSCGVALTSPTITTSSDLLRAADEAQYETKKRHRVEAQTMRSVGPPVAGGLGRRERRDSAE
ncbi:MAG: diguanylate cyclase, partial [Acidimicrobiales bacterium]|nr:diguanylate cyclase [Acidimicrobiales bacterium]